MQIKIILSIIVWSIAEICIFGQSDQNINICGYDHVLDVNDARYPGYKKAVNQTFDQALASVRHDIYTRGDEVFNIPVVVHVVWKNQEENLSDSIIRSQIRVLNESYRLQNANKNDIRDIFKDLQADAGIEFTLHEIKRVNTNASFALSLTGLPDKVKKSSDGGSDANNPDRFLNIWICRIQPIPILGAQILGYAYPPVDLSNWPAGSEAPSKELEGVVIDFRVFGDNNPNKLVLNGKTYDALGRTTVHEVGHYLGLRHIWGDGGGLFGGSSCNVDDGIADTPNQGAQTAGICDKTLNTCVDMTDDLPDMIENYMDYSAESCQNTFTNEQIGLMRSVLQNQRKLLVNTSSDDIMTHEWVASPNPATSTIQIAGQNGTLINNIIIKDIFGNTLKLYSAFYSSVATIDMSGLPQGQYFLYVYAGSKFKVIKIMKVND